MLVKIKDTLLAWLLGLAVGLMNAFPPNRLAILLAVPIGAGSAWATAWLTGHVPGVTLDPGFVNGLASAAFLAAVGFVYSWFKQWQRLELTKLTHVDRKLLSELPEPRIGTLTGSVGEGEELPSANPASSSVKVTKG